MQERRSRGTLFASNEVLDERDRLLGSNVRDHFPPEVAQEMLDVIGRVLATGATATYENTVEHHVMDRTEIDYERLSGERIGASLRNPQTAA